VAVPDFVGSTTDSALIVTLGGLGTVVAATYTPPVEINPCVESPVLGVASTISQNTLWSVVPFTVAVNVCIPPLFNDRLAGATVTLLAVGGGVPPPPLLVLPQEFTNEKMASPANKKRVRRMRSLVLKARPLR